MSKGKAAEKIISERKSYSSFFKSDTAIILLLALIKLLIHLLTNSQYGYNRDELYYLACGEHLSFGYVDHPPLTPLLAAIIRNTLGDSLFALRLLPALAGAALIFMIGLITREMGGNRYAQVLAAVCGIVTNIYLSMNTIFTTNAFDTLFWAIVLYLMVLILKYNKPKVWILIGIAIGIGLMTKHTMVFLCFGLLVGLLATKDRKFLLTKWPWYAGGIALIIFLPNLLWEISNGWPTIEFLSKAKINRMPAIDPLQFFLSQIYDLNPLLFLVLLVGIYHLLIVKKGERYRLFGWTYVALFVLFVLSKAKVYYLAPIYPVISASGAVLIERIISARKWRWAKSAILAILVVSGIVIAPIGLPILPVDTLAKYIDFWGLAGKSDQENGPVEIQMPGVFADMHGWEEMVATVAQVYNNLPPEEKAQCAVSANNYGQAAAIDFFGKKYGLPKVICSHNSYWYWGPRDHTGEIMITIGVRMQSLKPAYNQVEQAATVKNKYVIWYENNQPVYIWRGIKIPLQKAWPQMRLFY